MIIVSYYLDPEYPIGFSEVALVQHVFEAGLLQGCACHTLRTKICTLPVDGRNQTVTLSLVLVK